MGHEFWENEGIESLHNARNFNNVVWLHTMKCQYGVKDDSADKLRGAMDDVDNKVNQLMHKFDKQYNHTTDGDDAA